MTAIGFLHCGRGMIAPNFDRMGWRSAGNIDSFRNATALLSSPITREARSTYGEVTYESVSNIDG